MKRSILLLIILSFSKFSFSEERSKGFSPIVILFTASNSGAIKPCGCPTLRAGGLARRKRYIERERRKEKELLLFDSGSIFISKRRVGGFSFKDRIRKARLILKTYELMNYNAINLSWEDYQGLGGKEVKKLAEKFGIPIISSNLESTSGTSLKLRRFMTFEVKGVKISLLGISQYREIDNGLYFDKPLQIVEKMARGLRKDSDLIILLSSADLPMNREIRKRVRELDFILGMESYLTESYLEGKRKPYLLMIGGEGRYLGKLFINLGAERGEGLGYSKRLEELFDEVESIERSIRNLAKIDREDIKEKIRERISRFKAMKERIEGEIEKEAKGKNIFFFKRIMVKGDLGEDTEITKLLDLYTRGELKSF